MTAESTSRQPVPVVDCALYEYGRRRPGHLPLDEALNVARTTPGGFVWIGLHAPDADQLQVVARAFGLHPSPSRTPWKPTSAPNWSATTTPSSSSCAPPSTSNTTY